MASPNLGLQMTLSAPSRSTDSGVKNIRLILSRSLRSGVTLTLIACLAAAMSVANRTGMTPDTKSLSRYSVSKSHSWSVMVGMLSL